MSESKVFCEECRDDVSYTITEKLMEGCIKNEKYSYMGREAHCMECGSEIYLAEVNDFNLQALYNVYRKKNDIVDLEKILAIPKKYAIGKRPLSLLLGWGELTFSRYCDGDMPTKQYSDTLKKIYDDPCYYAEILERNKANIKDLTFKKSKRAVEELLGMTGKHKTKIYQSIEYLLNQCQDITPLALQKALYYIQGFYFSFYNEFLFFEDCEAWVHGPVYRDVYFRYRDYRFDTIDSTNDEFDDSLFSSSEKAILDSVVKNVCCYSGKVLEKFTHMEAPWLLTRADLAETMASDRIIPKEQIGVYFNAVKEKYNMITPNDIREYTKAMFEQI